MYNSDHSYSCWRLSPDFTNYDFEFVILNCSYWAKNLEIIMDKKSGQKGDAQNFGNLQISRDHSVGNTK